MSWTQQLAEHYYHQNVILSGYGSQYGMTLKNGTQINTDYYGFSQIRLVSTGEGFNLDYKQDFPKDLSKVICAFANTWGGVILIGIKEDGDGKPESVDGIPFQKGLDVKITNIVVSNISPPVFTEKKVITFKDSSSDRAIIIIGVPESDMTPHSVDHGRSIYVRTDDRNKPEKRATAEEIEWLLEKRRKAVELRRMLYTKSIERVANIYSFPALWSTEPQKQQKGIPDLINNLRLVPDPTYN